MRKIMLFSFSLIIIWGLWLSIAQPVRAQVYISEVLPNPTTASDASEWVELHNYSTQEIELQNWKLDGVLISPADSLKLAPDSFLTVAKNRDSFLSEFGTVASLTASSISLSNSGEELSLQNSEGQEVDKFSYSNTTSAKSWERAGPKCPETYPHTTGHTVSSVNSTSIPACWEEISDPPPPIPDSGLAPLKITEYLPNPIGSDTGTEWLEIYNTGTETVHLLELEVWDGSVKVQGFSANEFIPAQSYLKVVLVKSVLQNCSQPTDCIDKLELKWKGKSLQVVNYNDSVEGQSWSITPEGNWVLDWEVTPSAANRPRLAQLTTIRINEIFPYPQAPQLEWIELYNFGDTAVNLKDWKLADLSSTAGLPPTITVSPSSFVVLTGLSISFNNDEDTLKLIAPDKSTVDTFVYKSGKQDSVFVRDNNNIPLITSIATPGMTNIIQLNPPVNTEASSKKTSSAATSVPKPIINLSESEYQLPLLPKEKRQISIVGEPERIGIPVVTVAAATTVPLIGLGLWQSRNYLKKGWKRYWQWWKSG